MPTPKVTSLTPLPSTSAKWLKLQKATYTDAHGVSRDWELASRTTTPAAGIDAVSMATILHHPSRPPCTMLVLQFRPPVGAVTVEWPAGLIDAGESPQQAAVRELYEETGLVGEVRSVGPAVAADPGMTSAKMVLCMMEVWVKEGEELPEQHLEEGEDIQRVVVPLGELFERLEKLAGEGYVVAAKLYHWAAGMRYAMDHPELFGKKV
ncbi:hypothetical protein ACN47E_008419 [Coniothyrium glycines]